MLQRAVVVVGAGPGLGSAVARRFAREGYRAVLVARTPARLDLDGLTTPDGAAPLAVGADVTQEAGLRAAFARTRAEVGDPEVLVYNVSTWVPGAVTEVAYDDFVRGLLAGVAGALVSAQEVVPAMRAAGHGTVLVTGSGIATAASVASAALAAQKAAVRSLALSLAAELRPDGVHAATVTVRGALAAGTALDPDRVAETYWQLHLQSSAPPDSWRPEVEVSG